MAGDRCVIVACLSNDGLRSPPPLPVVVEAAAAAVAMAAFDAGVLKLLARIK